METVRKCDGDHKKIPWATPEDTMENVWEIPENTIKIQEHTMVNIRKVWKTTKYHWKYNKNKSVGNNQKWY